MEVVQENILENLEIVKNKIISNKKFENEIFISRKRKNPTKFYYERAYDLFFKLNFKDIYLYGLGSCVNLAVKTALIIIENIPNLKIELIETKTINHVDEFIDKNDMSLNFKNEERKSNLIKFKITKK